MASSATCPCGVVRVGQSMLTATPYTSTVSSYRPTPPHTKPDGGLRANSDTSPVTWHVVAGSARAVGSREATVAPGKPPAAGRRGPPRHPVFIQKRPESIESFALKLRSRASESTFIACLRSQSLTAFAWGCSAQSTCPLRSWLPEVTMRNAASYRNLEQPPDDPHEHRGIPPHWLTRNCL